MHYFMTLQEAHIALTSEGWRTEDYVRYFKWEAILLVEPCYVGKYRWTAEEL